MKNVFKDFYKNNFIFKGKEKLSKLTIVFIILLDLFVLSILQMGIDFQVNIINNPNNSYSKLCNNLVNSNKIKSFESYYYYTYENEHKYNNIQKEEISPSCKQIVTLLDEVKKQHNINELRKENQILKNELRTINNQLDFYRKNYNTKLFENIQTDNTKNIDSSIKEKYNIYLEKNKELANKIDNLEKTFSSSKSVKELVSYIDINKDLIKENHKAQIKIYEVKKDLITLAFLIPLLLVAFYSMKKFMLKENYVVYVIAKNILVIISIPTIISFISLVYTLLPKVFFEKLMQFFANLEIPFVVYYFALGVLVIIFTFIIIRIQKKYRESSSEFQNTTISKIESFNKGICNSCNNKVNYETMNFCPNCKNELRVKCNSCGNMTISFLKYCCSCGEER